MLIIIDFVTANIGPIAVIVGTPTSIFSGICVTQWLLWFGTMGGE